MTIYYIKCPSGYWAGFEVRSSQHTYSYKKEDGVKFFSNDEAEIIAKSWVASKLEKFTIEEVEYYEGNIV